MMRIQANFWGNLPGVSADLLLQAVVRSRPPSAPSAAAFLGGRLSPPARIPPAVQLASRKSAELPPLPDPVQVLENDARFRRLPAEGQAILRLLIGNLWKAYLETLDRYRADPASLPHAYDWRGPALDGELAEGVIRNYERQGSDQPLPTPADLASLHFEMRQRIERPERIFPWPSRRPTRKPTEPSHTELFGQMVRAARKEKGWTLEQVASKLVATRSAISAWELGKQRPSSVKLERLLEILPALQKRRSALYRAWRKNS